MDHYHARVARVALSVLGRYGFVLAGGYAVQAHGIIDRPSDDVDLFTNVPDLDKFDRATLEAIAAWEQDGLTVSVDRRSGTFARLIVSDGRREMIAELSYDWRADPPAHLDIGPVLSRDDSVANKVGAIFTRGEARDYIDVYGARTNGHYTRQQLEDLGASHDGGFDAALFAQALRRSARHPDSAYADYGLAPHTIGLLRAELTEWADDIDNRP